jgi:hypothetical protein
LDVCLETPKNLAEFSLGRRFESNMDDKTIDLLARAINEGVTSTSWAILALAAVTAGAHRVHGCVSGQKGEHRAIRENFREALDQMKEQTRATKAVEAEIAERLHYRTEILLPRLDAYKALWAATDIVRPTRQGAISTKEKEKLRQTLTSWYYNNGNGIFLSIVAERDFRDARQALNGEATRKSRSHSRGCGQH